MKRSRRPQLLSTRKLTGIILAYIAILTVMLLFLLYISESSDIVGFAHYKPQLTVNQDSNEYVLSWPKIPYFAYYEVEVLSAPPKNDMTKSPRSQIVTRYQTLSNELTIEQQFPFRTYWRVSARSLFRQKLGRYSDHIMLAGFSQQPSQEFRLLKPIPISSYPADSPAPAKPMLTWTTVPGAVYYEWELLSAPPENPNDTEPSSNQLFITREVFTNGYNPVLTGYHEKKLYWRVRALDQKGNPLGVFSDAVELYWDPALHIPIKPLINAVYNKKGAADLLYPVYSWIPVTGAVSYEVELSSQLPENPNSVEPSRYRIWGKEVVGLTDCYDDLPRITPGVYYWRVKGLDSAGNPVGVYSDSGQFSVDLKKGNYAATFGDSITHGGGAISYSPSDWEYSFQTYLNFPTVNLGKSGDTSEAMLERFDRDVLPYKPRFLLIMGGSNSLRGGVPAAQVIRELTGIRDKCYNHGIRPIFLTLPPINPEAIYEVFQEETVPNWQNEFAAVNRFIRQQRYYIDLEPYFLDSNRELPSRFAIDGLHLDIEGKKLMGQIINNHWAQMVR